MNAGVLQVMLNLPSGWTTASMALPLPPSPTSLSGMAFYVQWAVLDPQGAFGALGLTFALSEAHTIYVW